MEEAGMSVRQIRIDLSSAERINYLVEIVSRFPENIYLVEGETKVSAKSVVGIFSLDLTKPVTMEVAAGRCGELLEKLSPYFSPLHL
jgi:phosphocarrier protein HPr